MKLPELGESDGASKRTESDNGAKLDASANMCVSGFSDVGIEWEIVGPRAVGGSHLTIAQRDVGLEIRKAHLKQATKTLNFLTGTGIPVKISAKRSTPRPLLVVHSGNTAIGRLAELRMLSRDATEPAEPGSGMLPANLMMDSRDMTRNPLIGMRFIEGRLDGVETFADPVPVPRPVL